jgi:hypothetical protein
MKTKLTSRVVATTPRTVRLAAHRPGRGPGRARRGQGQADTGQRGHHRVHVCL